MFWSEMLVALALFTHLIKVCSFEPIQNGYHDYCLYWCWARQREIAIDKNNQHENILTFRALTFCHSSFVQRFLSDLRAGDHSSFLQMLDKDPRLILRCWLGWKVSKTMSLKVNRANKKNCLWARMEILPLGSNKLNPHISCPIGWTHLQCNSCRLVGAVTGTLDNTATSHPWKKESIFQNRNANHNTKLAMWGWLELWLERMTLLDFSANFNSVVSGNHLPLVSRLQEQGGSIGRWK